MPQPEPHWAQISGLWAQLSSTPLDPHAWLALCQHYASSGLALQSGYAARQVRRLKPEWESRLPSSAGKPALQQAQMLEPISGGDHQGAVYALAQLVERRPLRHGSMLHLGEALLRVGNRIAADVAFTRASSSRNPAFLRPLVLRTSHLCLADKENLAKPTHCGL